MLINHIYVRRINKDGEKNSTGGSKTRSLKLPKRSSKVEDAVWTTHESFQRRRSDSLHIENARSAPDGRFEEVIVPQHDGDTPTRKAVVFCPQEDPPSLNGKYNEAEPDLGENGGQEEPSLDSRQSLDYGLIRRKQISMSRLYALAEQKGTNTANACKKSSEAHQTLLTLLSGLYALFIVILAIALEVSRCLASTGDDQHLSVKFEKVEVFYLYLYAAGLVFLGFCQIFLFRSRSWSLKDFWPRKNSMEIRARENIAEQLAKQRGSNRFGSALSHKRKVTHSGPAAGSLYLRLGCLFFGLCGIVYFGLMCYEENVGPHPNNFKIVSNAFACVFIFAQMLFIFENSKLTIHRFRLICRFGTMHLVATNICVWIRFFLLEVMHTTHEFRTNVHNAEQMALIQMGNHSAGEQEDHGSVQAHQQHAVQNGGGKGHHSANKVAQDSGIHSENCSAYSFNLQCHVPGLQPFLITSLVEYSIIGAAVMFILWRNIDLQPSKEGKHRKMNFRVDCSASTKGLFLGILAIIFAITCIVIFFVRINLKKVIEALWLLYSAKMIIYLAAILATFVGGYRMRNMSYVSFHKGYNVLLLDDILLFVGFVGQVLYCIFVLVLLNIKNPITIMLEILSFVRMIQVTSQTIFILCAQRMVALTPYLQRKKPGRQMVTFLLIANLGCFVITIFEIHKASVDPLMLDFYGEFAYNILVHSTVPLNIFYRFHSSVCLCEIWKSAYREHTNNFDGE